MWHSTRIVRRISRTVAAILAGVALLTVSGCMTTDNSDMPWNTPQSWEGTPSIPGLTGGQ